MTTSGNLGTTDFHIGGDFDTWGSGYVADMAILNKMAGSQHIVTDTSGNIALTTADCQNFSILANGSGSTIVNIRVPDSISRFHYLINDRATGSITYRCAAGGSAVTLAAGERRLVYSDGTDCVDLTLLSIAIAGVSGLQAALDAKAALASPPLSGTPTAPTAAPGTNTTQLATTGFVKAAIDVVLGGVSAAYDTLAEIATAIGGMLVAANNLSDLPNKSTSRTNLGVAIGSDVQAYDAQTAKLNVEDQTIAGGARITIKDLGALSAAGSNTITPDPGDRPTQSITNDHAGSILPGSNAGDYLLEVNNTTGAGALTTTGWTLKGDSFDTTTTSKFLCACHVTANQKVMSITKVA